MMHGFAKLELSDDQRAKIEVRMTAARTELGPKLDAMRQARRALREATEVPVIDEGAIRAAAAELSGIEADLAIAHAKMRQEIRALLTPDQQAKLDAMKAERKERGAERSGDRMRRQRGGTDESNKL
jgi:Spy/CpxP family protein refolding chaperone